MAWRVSREAWLLVTLALGACQPLGELPLPPTALTGGAGGKALAETRERPSATPTTSEGDGHAADED